MLRHPREYGLIDWLPAVRHPVDLNHSLLPYDVVGTYDVGERAFINELVGHYPFQNQLRFGRHQDVVGLAPDVACLPQPVRDRKFALAELAGNRGGKQESGVVANRYAYFPIAPPNELVQVSRKDPRRHPGLAKQHQPVVAGVVSKLLVPGDGDPCGHVGTPVPFVVGEYRDSAEIHIILHDFLARGRIDDPEWLWVLYCLEDLCEELLFRKAKRP